MSDVKSVVLFVVDGMRPDGLRQANTPQIDALLHKGAATFRARTVMPSVTLPCHTSLFRGVDPERHGITSNVFTPLARPVPSLIDATHKAGKIAASFYNWEELRDLSSPGSLTASFFLKDCHSPEGDQILAELAAGWLGVQDFDFAFVYLGYTDNAGHWHGWMSDPYLRAIENADECVRIVVESLRAAGKLKETTFLVTSDHGGHGKTHGTDSDEDMTTPLILSGAGIRPGLDVTDPVHITDIAPTIAALLGIDPPAEWTGKPILAALA